MDERDSVKLTRVQVQIKKKKKKTPSTVCFAVPDAVLEFDFGWPRCRRRVGPGPWAGGDTVSQYEGSQMASVGRAEGTTRESLRDCISKASREHAKDILH